MAAWRSEPGGLRLVVRLTPKAGADRVDGLVTLSDGSDALRARVRAVPESGKANEALVATLASALSIPRSRISIVAGVTSRRKDVRIETDRPDILVAILSSLPRLDPPAEG